MNTDTPRIYAACLASYNQGELHGAWIDATQGVDGIRQEIATMLEASPVRGAEEYAIHDYEHFGPLKLSEHEDLEQVARAAELFEQHGEIALLLASYYGGLEYLDEVEEALCDRYLGHYTDLSDWAWQLLDDLGDLAKVPQRLLVYLDVERYARDLERSGEFIVLTDASGEIHVLSAY